MNTLELRQESKQLEPQLRIGKQGITDGIVQELQLLLKKKKMVKIKLLKSALEQHSKKEYFDQLIARSNAQEIHRVGFTITLRKGGPA